MGSRSYPALYLFTVALLLKGSYTWQLEEDSANGLTKTQRRERDSSGFCPDGWYMFEDFCYMIGPATATWNGADSFCKSKNSNLISIHSQAEQDFLITLMYEIRSKVWIGLKRSMYRREVFEWSDSSPVDYSNWVEGEPNNYRGVEGCAHMFFDDCDVGEWNDAPCGASFSYICKKPKDPVLTQRGRDPSQCTGRPGWFMMRGSCYKVFHETNSFSSWSQAQSLCKSYGGNLAFVKNSGINKLLEMKTKELQGPSWIGIKSKKNHKYTWLGKNHPLMYSNWQTDQPKEVQDQQNCVSMDAEGKWIIRDCKERHPFVCEIGPEPSEPRTLESYGKNMTCSYTSKKWHDIGGKYCYIIELTAEATWAEALCRCKEVGGSLASIHSSEEQNIILHYIKYHEMPEKPLFVGLVRDTTGTFVWSDGSAYDYINWAQSEPNSNVEQCGQMDTATGKWNDIHCHQRLGYVCSTLKVPVRGENFSSSETNELTGKKSKLSGGTFAGIIVPSLLIVVMVSVSLYIFRSSLKTKFMVMVNRFPSSRLV